MISKINCRLLAMVILFSFLFQNEADPALQPQNTIEQEQTYCDEMRLSFKKGSTEKLHS